MSPSILIAPASNGTSGQQAPLCHVLAPDTFQPICGSNRTGDRPVHSASRCQAEQHCLCVVCAGLQPRAWPT